MNFHYFNFIFLQLQVRIFCSLENENPSLAITDTNNRQMDNRRILYMFDAVEFSVARSQQRGADPAPPCTRLGGRWQF